VVYEDGATEKFHRNVSVWEKGNKTAAVNFYAGIKIQKIKLGSTYVPDVDKKNNVYISK